MLAALALALAAPPAGLAAEAAAVKPLARTDLGRAFVAAADGLPAFAPRSVYRKKGDWKSAADYEKLPADQKAGWQETPVDADTYHGLFYGTPLAYLLLVDRLADAGGDLRGKKVLDFGHGGVGQLRLFAALGATAVGVDVDPRQLAVYSHPTDQGSLGTAGGSVKLVHGRWPAEPKAVEAVGGGYDVILSKNTLKNGYLHPAEPVDPRARVDVGVDDPAFLKACHAALKPGGFLVIYNLSPAPAPPGKPYRPMADGRCPFAAADLAAGFETLARDENQDARARKLGVALGWDQPPVSMKLDADLFALATVLRRK
jgi:SAM-dependent methyltransferase